MERLRRFSRTIGNRRANPAAGDLRKFKLVKKKRMCYPKPKFESLSTELFSSVIVFRSVRPNPVIGTILYPTPLSPSTTRRSAAAIQDLRQPIQESFRI